MTKASEVDYDVATIFNIIDLCQNMHTLPLPGGLFDQDSLFVDLYQHVGQLRNTRHDMDQRQQQANTRLAKARQH